MILRHTRLALLLLVGMLLLTHLSTSAQSATESTYFFPLVSRPKDRSIFGVQTFLGALSDAQVAAQARDLGVYWVRLQGVNWAEVEPARGEGYNWAALGQIDADLSSAAAAGLTPVVVFQGNAPWATVTGTSCGAVRDEYIGDFVNFLSAVVARYRGRVNYWEIGNEPDVDPRLVSPTSVYGCWGDTNDPYYGGGRFGRMLQAAAPTIRAANPFAQIVFGGLLLDRPLTTAPGYGRPELFFEGALRAGAASAFDVVAYHAYAVYMGDPTQDYDLSRDGPWADLGGWTLGKAAYVRGMMSRYGVDKPLWLNETALICPINPQQQCTLPVDASFSNAQADYLVRMVSRAAAAQIEQVAWFTMDSPGWRGSSLLDASQSPRPAYIAYQHLIGLTAGYGSVAAVDYGPAIEAYRFTLRDGVVDVLWSRSADPVVAQVPTSAFRSAIIWDGATPAIESSGPDTRVTVGFRAVFIERAP